MSVAYRQSIVVELDGQTEDELFRARLRFEKAMSELGRELSKLKGSGGIIAILPGKVREWDPYATKPKG